MIIDDINCIDNMETFLNDIKKDFDFVPDFILIPLKACVTSEFSTRITILNLIKISTNKFCHKLNKLNFVQLVAI